MLLENWVSLISTLIMVLLFGTILGTVFLYGRYKNQNAPKAKPAAPKPAVIELPVSSPAPQVLRRQIAFR